MANNSDSAISLAFASDVPPVVAAPIASTNQTQAIATQGAGSHAAALSARDVVRNQGPLVSLDLTGIQDLCATILRQLRAEEAKTSTYEARIDDAHIKIQDVNATIAHCAGSKEVQAVDHKVDELSELFYTYKTSTELSLQGLKTDIAAFKSAAENSQGRSGALERALLDDALGTARAAKDAAHAARSQADLARTDVEKLASRVGELEAGVPTYATKQELAEVLEVARAAQAHSARVLQAAQTAGKQATEAMASASSLRAEWDAAQASMRMMLEATAKRQAEAMDAADRAEAAARMFSAQSTGNQNAAKDLATRLYQLEEFRSTAMETIAVHEDRTLTALDRVDQVDKTATMALAEGRDNNAMAQRRHAELDKRLVAAESSRASLEEAWTVFREGVPEQIKAGVSEGIAPVRADLDKLGGRLTAVADFADVLEREKADKAGVVTPAKLKEVADGVTSSASDARTSMRSDLEAQISEKADRLAIERALATLEESVRGGDTAIALRLRDLSASTDHELGLKADAELVNELADRIDEIKILFDKLRNDLSGDRMHWSNVGGGKATNVKVMESFHNQFGGIGSRELLDPKQAKLFGSSSEYMGRRRAGGQLRARKKQQQTLYTWGAHIGQNPYDVHGRPLTAPGGGTISGRAHSPEMDDGARAQYLTAVWQEAERSEGDLNSFPADESPFPNSPSFPRRTGSRTEQTSGRGGHHQNRNLPLQRRSTPEPEFSMPKLSGGLYASASTSSVPSGTGPFDARSAIFEARPATRHARTPQIASQGGMDGPL